MDVSEWVMCVRLTKSVDTRIYLAFVETRHLSDVGITGSVSEEWND